VSLVNYTKFINERRRGGGWWVGGGGGGGGGGWKVPLPTSDLLQETCYTSLSAEALLLFGVRL